MRKRECKRIKKAGLCLVCALLLCSCGAEKKSEADITVDAGTTLAAKSREEGSSQPESSSETSGKEQINLEESLPAEEPMDEAFYNLATDIPAAEVEAFAKQVKEHLLSQDWKALSEKLSYPITIDGETYQTKEEFLTADFGETLNPYFFVELEEESCSQMFCNYTGIMLGETGRVWIAEILNDDFSSQGLKVKAINGLTKSFGLPGRVRMSAQESDITPTSIKLLLENETDLNIIFGDDYRLWKFDGETWHEVEPLVDDVMYKSIGYMPKRGNPVEWTSDWSRLYGKLENGTYQITKTVTDKDAMGDSGTYERTFGFTIGDQQ